MLSPILLTVALSLFAGPVMGRERWLERDDRAVLLHPRRFGQEHPAVIEKLSAACEGGVCGTLAGQAITPLLAAQGECTQQDMADAIIDASRQFDDATQQNMIALAQEYRQAEKNTPPDFTTNPPANRNSVFCQKAPKNAELNGLVQAQDPANDPELFFDPATKATVKLGDQANTQPFGGSASGSASSAAASADSSSSTVASSADASSSTAASSVDASSSSAESSVTSTASDAAATSADCGSTADAGSVAAASSDIGDFGSCTTPQIEFGVGFDNRKETSFRPVDSTSYNHGSAQNIDIITQFMCDTLTNSCNADDTAKATCQSAVTASKAAAVKTGAQADAFNAVFGITTDFASQAAIDDQGNVVSSGTGSSAAVASSDSSSTAESSAASSSVTSTASDAAATSADCGSAADAGTVTAASSNIGDFGSCTTPQIEFGVGFDNRKETSFRPVDTTSYNHGSAQNMDIISQFMCDTLTNTCGADDTAKATCQSAIAASKTAEAKTGAQADAFNAVFGITTDFASQDVVDNQGNVVSSGKGSTAASVSSDASSASATDAASVTDAANDCGGVTASATATASSSASTDASASTGDADFGSCSTPQIEFGVGFDNRKETSFEPVDKTSFDHGSAQAIGIISQFICDTLTNKCAANQAAKDLCAQAQTAATGGTPKTGGQADAFNAVFGITTDFANVTPIDDQGREVNTGAASTAAADSSADSTTDTASTDASSADASSTDTSSAAAASSTDASSTDSTATAGNLQTFTGSLGDVTAPAVTATGDGKFSVEGNSVFNNEQNALIRSCDVQHNKCANAANSSGNSGDLTVEACGTQQTDCNAQATGSS
ncbi:hypothetical protein BD626DRAFT_240688 [Schizophyllum amplum]|uniref:Uncharacterized protein n=1 Tax=Schizophyllum amplum TaxID=97359 RepID=A0A550CJW0_9AGAR|nr:hypothetical protein BD626DRAFT_240688 [Auriculariopsis ampla]